MNFKQPIGIKVFHGEIVFWLTYHIWRVPYILLTHAGASLKPKRTEHQFYYMILTPVLLHDLNTSFMTQS